MLSALDIAIGAGAAITLQASIAIVNTGVPCGAVAGD
jgi:hypothetical protein